MRAGFTWWSYADDLDRAIGEGFIERRIGIGWFQKCFELLRVHGEAWARENRTALIVGKPGFFGIDQVCRANHGKNGCPRAFSPSKLFHQPLSGDLSWVLSANWLTTLPCASMTRRSRSISILSASTRFAPCQALALPS